MEKNKMIFCNTCKHYRGGEIRVSEKFIEEDPECEKGERLYLDVIDYGFGPGIKMCHHPICFEIKCRKTTARPKKCEKERVRGQGQLNKNNDCRYYEKNPWWRFWR
jgi:hypothetical protein